MSQIKSQKMKNKKSLKLNLYLFYLLENLKKRYCNISLILFYIEVITWLRLWYREIKIVSNLSAIKNTNLYWSIEIINKCCFHTRFLVKQQQVYFFETRLKLLVASNLTLLQILICQVIVFCIIVSLRSMWYYTVSLRMWLLLL